MAFKQPLAKNWLTQANLATTYTAGGTSTGWNTGRFDQLRVYFAHTWTDSTSVEFILEFSDDGGTTWYPDSKISSGTSTDNEITRAVAADDEWSHQIDVQDVSWIRIKVKQTAGATAGNGIVVSYTGGSKR